MIFYRQELCYSLTFHPLHYGHALHDLVHSLQTIAPHSVHVFGLDLISKQTMHSNFYVSLYSVSAVFKRFKPITSLACLLFVKAFFWNSNSTGSRFEGVSI